jgi:hypothetical protein
MLHVEFNVLCFDGIGVMCIYDVNVSYHFDFERLLRVFIWVHCSDIVYFHDLGNGVRYKQPYYWDISAALACAIYWCCAAAQIYISVVSTCESNSVFGAC